MGGREEPVFERVRESLLVNVASGDARPRQLGEGDAVRFGWAPNEDLFAYSSSGTLYLESVDGDVREVPLSTAIGDVCSFCDSFGWSSDGRYIGLTDWWQKIVVLDTDSGEVRAVVQEEGENQFIEPKWWR